MRPRWTGWSNAANMCAAACLRLHACRVSSAWRQQDRHALGQARRPPLVMAHPSWTVAMGPPRTRHAARRHGLCTWKSTCDMPQAVGNARAGKFDHAAEGCLSKESRSACWSTEPLQSPNNHGAAAILPSKRAYETPQTITGVAASVLRPARATCPGPPLHTIRPCPSHTGAKPHALLVVPEQIPEQRGT